MSCRYLFLLVLMGVLAPAMHAADKLPPLDRAAAEKVGYRQDVWPILKRHCWGCHSSMKPEGGLKLDSVADMRKGGDGGPLFKPGKPDESLLLTMISGDKPKMPRKQPPLSGAKVQMLRLWILAGARDDSTAEDTRTVVKVPERYRFAPAVTSVAFSPDGKHLAAACRSEVVLLDPEGKSPPVRLATESDLLSHVEFSPDGKLLAAVGGSPSRYGEVRFFDLAGKLVSSRRVGHDTLFRGNFAPDSKVIAVGGADGAVHIIPVNSREKPRKLELHSDWVLDVVYSPDGKMLVSGGRDKATKVSSVETGELLRSVDSSTELVSAVASDGQFAVSSGRGRALIGYEYRTALAGIQVTGAGNGARPISRRAQYVRPFETQPGEVLSIATSADRKLIAVAGDYGDVRVYRIADRQRVALISKVPAPIYGVALNRDGSRLALGSKSGPVQVYELPSGKLLKSLTPVPVATSRK
jgi:WD40 repeat protein